MYFYKLILLCWYVIKIRIICKFVINRRKNIELSIEVFLDWLKMINFFWLWERFDFCVNVSLGVCIYVDVYLYMYINVYIFFECKIVILYLGKIIKVNGYLYF